ncbi:hypothetical protein HDU92_008245 [Lobulomyces angularis]|nr:hypothetical protein HDU92_008245 [Lobulomyces angularis]
MLNSKENNLEKSSNLKNLKDSILSSSKSNLSKTKSLLMSKSDDDEDSDSEELNQIFKVQKLSPELHLATRVYSSRLSSYQQSNHSQLSIPATYDVPAVFNQPKIIVNEYVNYDKNGK